MYVQYMYVQYMYVQYMYVQYMYVQYMFLNMYVQYSIRIILITNIIVAFLSEIMI